MLNRATLVGRITKNLEMRTSSNGKNFVGFTLAVNSTFKDNNGNIRADFISCISWNKTADNMVRYLKKGSLISVDGTVSTSNKDGVYKTFINAQSVNFLESKKESSNNSYGNDYNLDQNINNRSNSSSFNPSSSSLDNLPKKELDINNNIVKENKPFNSGQNKEDILFDENDILWE